MTPGKEGPGKGKNITVSADFLSGLEYQNCLQISIGIPGLLCSPALLSHRTPECTWSWFKKLLISLEKLMNDNPIKNMWQSQTEVKKKKFCKKWVDLNKVLLKDQHMLHDQTVFFKTY